MSTPKTFHHPEPLRTMNERHRQKRQTFFRYTMALLRSIYFNFRMLPFRQAIHLPILVSHRTRLENLGGSITIDAPCLRMGLIKIGFSTYQQTNFHTDRTRLNLRGTIVFCGESDWGAGCAIEVAEDATLRLGNHSHIGPKTLIICHKGIIFGDYARCSWCCTFMDTDQHRLIDADGRWCNEDREIVLHDHVWIGCHVVVAKGTQLPPFTTVGTGSIVFGKHQEERTVLAGNPAVVIKHGLVREDYIN